MKDLQKMEVSELNLETLKMTEGGVWYTPSFGISALVFRIVVAIAGALNDGDPVSETL